MHQKTYYLYILSNINRKVLYVGMTNNLLRRLFEHRYVSQGFVKKYKVFDLLYFESTANVHAAIAREKELKKWRRQKKYALIALKNPYVQTLEV